MDYLSAGLSLLKEIKDLGYEAYIVGGAVRDHLLNKKVNDIDITTSMPLSMLETKYKNKNTGGKYLSITIFYAGYSFEITNFRKDIKYYNNRFPDVEIVDDFKTDTLRRDFTINAMAYDYLNNLIDYHNGLSDLKNKLIRAIGNPDIRFNEDALRILRCLAFSSKLDFEIEEETLKSIIKNKNLLKNLSDERIYEYFEKLYKYSNKKGVEYINKYDLFEYIPDYKRALEIAKDDYNHQDISVIYYLKYHDYFALTTQKEKKTIKIINDLINNKFSKFIIYKNQNLEEYENILKYLNIDYEKIIDIKNNLIIKNDKELALSKKEISEILEASKRNKFINYITNEILEERIKNDKDVIKNEALKWM